MSEIFPPEILVQFISDSIVLRRFRRTCTAFRNLTVSGRWGIIVELTGYVTFVRHVVGRTIVDTNLVCPASNYAPARWVNVITTGIFGERLLRSWYCAQESSGEYAALIAREYLLTGKNPIISYRTTDHYFPSPVKWYEHPTNRTMVDTRFGRSIVIDIDPADYSVDNINKYFIEREKCVLNSCNGSAVITLRAPADKVLAYFGHNI